MPYTLGVPGTERSCLLGVSVMCVKCFWDRDKKENIAYIVYSQDKKV